jgi:hypothetical protein
MDIRHFIRVMSRFKRLVIGGTVAGAVLAVLAYGNPGFVNGKPTIIPRGGETWQSQSELLLNGPGDPYGRIGSGAQAYAPVQTYMSDLAPIYSAIANGDAIQSQIHSERPRVVGSVSASAGVNWTLQSALPIVTLTATAKSSGAAAMLARRGAAALQAYSVRAQTGAGILANERVSLSILKSSSAPVLIESPKMTTSLLVFVVFFLGSVSLALVLENARPRSLSMGSPKVAQFPGSADGRADGFANDRSESLGLSRTGGLHRHAASDNGHRAGLSQDPAALSMTARRALSTDITNLSNGSAASDDTARASRFWTPTTRD